MEGQKRLAFPGGADLLGGVLRNLALEQVEERLHRARQDTALLAQALRLHHGTKVAKERQVARLALLAADIGKNRRNLMRALVAKDTASAALVTIERANVQKRLCHAVFGGVDADVVAA